MGSAGVCAYPQHSAGAFSDLSRSRDVLRAGSSISQKVAFEQSTSEFELLAKLIGVLNIHHAFQRFRTDHELDDTASAQGVAAWLILGTHLQAGELFIPSDIRLNE